MQLSKCGWPTATACLLVALCISLGLTTPAAAQQPSATRDWFGWREWNEWPRAAGEWDEIRSDLEARGLIVTASAIADVSRLRSQSNAQTTIGRTLFGLGAEADLSKMTRLPGATGYVQLQYRSGANASDVLGDLQVFSNIDANEVPYLGEAWLQLQLAPRVRAKTGRIDANSEFAAIEASSDFIASAMALTPTLDGLPTYPSPTLGALVAMDATPHIRLAAATFDTAPQDRRLFNWAERLSIIQAGGLWQAPLAGSGQAGWFTRRDAAGAQISGGYFTAEQQIWQRNDRAATAFLVLGQCNGPCAIARHAGGGTD